ncbi:MAG: response regulator [Proteobacteria bacterium]|nr:response regulator [Pseudomonadota bacterium]
MKKKILIIDDDQLILYGLQKALRRQTIEVTTAATAGAAMDKLCACLYDLCLLDIHLPDYNGLELMKAIRHICPKTKVIIMTASYMGDDELSANIKQAAENGACHFMTKPFDLSEVKDMIQQALADEDFHTGVRFTDNAFVKKTRKLQRSPHSQGMKIAMTVLGEGETQRRYASARSVDISNSGIGLLTRYPLQVKQILSFRANRADKTGIVVWSTMQENNTCRAGVRFA